MGAGTATGDASIGNDTLRSIEAIQGTNFNDMYDASTFGTAGALNIGNNGTFNQFEGLGGDDTITGNGNTRVIYSSATAGVTMHMAAGTVTGDASVGTDTFTRRQQRHRQQPRRHLRRERLRRRRRRLRLRQLQPVRRPRRQRHHHRQRQHPDRLFPGRERGDGGPVARNRPRHGGRRRRGRRHRHHHRRRQLRAGLELQRRPDRRRRQRAVLRRRRQRRDQRRGRQRPDHRPGRQRHHRRRRRNRHGHLHRADVGLHHHDPRRGTDPGRRFPDDAGRHRRPHQRRGPAVQRRRPCFLSSGTAANPIDVSAMGLGFNGTVVRGTAADDYLVVGGTVFGHPIDLGAGDDTVILGQAAGTRSTSRTWST